MRIGCHAEEQKRKSTGYRLDYYSKHASSTSIPSETFHDAIHGASRRPTLPRERASAARLGYACETNLAGGTRSFNNAFQFLIYLDTVDCIIVLTKSV